MICTVSLISVLIALTAASTGPFPVQITEFLIQAMNKGSDDVGRVHVQVRCGQMLVHGFSANTDVVKAAVEAFVDALNLLNATEKAE